MKIIRYMEELERSNQVVSKALENTARILYRLCSVMPLTKESLQSFIEEKIDEAEKELRGEENHGVSRLRDALIRDAFTAWVSLKETRGK